jgi:hypothetical protein
MNHCEPVSGKEEQLTADPELTREEVIEVPLLLPGWQMSALEQAAHCRGLTAGEMVRHLLADFFCAGGKVRLDTPAGCKAEVG